MIRNDDELVHTQQQAARVELIVRSLHEEMKNPENFRLFAESAVDLLIQLRGEIDEYLGVPILTGTPDIAAAIRADAAREGLRYQIRSQAGLAEAQEALANMELALASLKRTMLPKNERNFQIFAETYVAHIMGLRAQIDAFIGVLLVLVAPQPLSPTGS